ncbi:hypothetical protein HFO56_02190 [Rhizobium laguerreae]|uniref:hypothetical protein n=1 Tax=Rhizobium laguerreae TaxID=1076926 RepID=UPI001C9206CB|nr:hypothetical protein [Rhizobium laguerreae]MBY3151215.1 hypothetical protein [Rhizobium laguerreae]
MKFDWSMIKGMPNNRDTQRVQVPMPVEKPRFDIPADSYPVKLDQRIPLLDFIVWCVPSDPTADLGAIGRLYASIENGEESVRAAPPVR